MASKLPKGWIKRHNAVYYQVPKAVRHEWDGKTWFRLGKSVSEAYRTWYARLRSDADEWAFERMADVIESYRRERLPLLKESTQGSYAHHLKPLITVFGAMRPKDITPHHVYRYMEARSATPVGANREVSVLIKVMDHAVRKGAVKRNQLKGQIEKFREQPRERAVELAELHAFCELASPKLRAYVALKRITGVRQGQLLSIDLGRQWRNGELTIPKAKNGRDVTYFGEDLEAVVEFILYQRGVTDAIGPLFVNERGRPMTATGLKSEWSRTMKRYVEAGGERFNEHDIRSHVADRVDDVERAAELLGHVDSRTTARVYRRKSRKIQALDL